MAELAGDQSRSPGATDLDAIGAPIPYPGSKRQRILLVSLVLCWGAALGVLIYMAYGSRLSLPRGALTYIGVWMITAAVCASLAWKFAVGHRFMRPFDLLEPPLYMSLIWLFWISSFGIAAYFDPLLLEPGLYSTDLLPQGMLLISVGLAGLWMGYGLLKRWLLRQATKPTPIRVTPPSLVVVLVFYAGLLAVRLFLTSRGLGETYNRSASIGVWEQWLIYLVELRWPLVALIILQTAARKWRRGYLLAVMTSELGLALLTGWAGPLVRLLALTASGWLYGSRRSLPWRMLLVFATVLLLTAPLIRSVRGIRAGEELSTLQRSTNTYLSPGAGNALDYSRAYLIARQSSVAQTPALVAQMTPRIISYRPLSELLLSPLSFIPRVLWPGKPVYADLQSIIATEYMGLPPGLGSPAVTDIANLYMYGGWPVVLGGMAVYGAILALLYGLLAVPGIVHKVPSLLALYGSVFITVHGAGGEDFVGSPQVLIQRLLIFGAFLYVIQLLSERHN